jgi:hypothetical protein
MSRFLNIRTALVTVAALMMVTSVSAQTTTGRLVGNVVDDTAAALPGVTVTISSPVLIGGAQTKITDGAGEFAFIGITPGEYTLKADLSGFISQERNEILVALGGSRTITIEMPMGTFGGEIEVVAETPVVDPTQVNTNVNYTDTYLQGSAIGTNNRSYQNVLGQAAGVTGQNVFGSTVGENAYYVDGANTTDPVTATWGTNFTFDSIQEIQFQTSGYEAEYGSATGGIVNLVTKSGGNQFAGTVDIRYRDDSMQESGDNYDASTLNSQRQEIDATLGGPILRDKLWFFAAYQYVNSETTPSGAPTTFAFKGQYPLVKLTWQAGSNWRVTGKWTADPADIDNADASPFIEPEASSFQTQGADIYSAEVNGVLSDSLMWNTVISAYRSTLDSFPQSGNLAPIGRFNLDTGISSVNSTNQQYSKRNRDDITSNLTWFVDDLAGSHEFKGGIVYSDLNFTSANCTTGTAGGVQCDQAVPGNRFETLDIGGDFPYVWWQEFNTGTTETKGTNSTAFLQDAWRVMPNLTLKLGVRYDIAQYDTTNGTQVADMSKLQPRVGAAWDITGDAKNILRANWGYFMSPNALTLPNFARTGVAPSNAWLSCSFFLGLDAEGCEAWAAARPGIEWSMDPEGFDPGGWVLTPNNIFGSEPSQIDPNLKAMYTETFSLAYEREVGRRAAVTVTYVDKTTNDIFEDTCDGNVGPNGPSADASCNYYLMANLPELTRDYQGFILEYSTRTLDWLTLNTSYTWSESKGSQEYNQNAGVDFDYFPVHYDNRYGYLNDHREHRFKLNGFFSIKGDWTIGFDGFYSSAFTWEPQANSSNAGQVWEGVQIPDNIPYGTYYVEPRGNRDGASIYQLDLQVSKGFTVGQSLRLVLIGSAFNVFSSENVTGICIAINGCGGDTLTGGATGWQTPRRYEVGFRVEF